MIVVTGANSFVEQALSARLVLDNLPARLTVRTLSLRPHAHQYSQPHTHLNSNPDPNLNSNSTHQFAIGHISADTDWSKALKDAQSVVHLALRLHVLNDHSSDPVDEYRVINVERKVNLARQAAASGVKRFIFVSVDHGMRLDARQFQL
jgi:nucleoside-diphosphate-sugar epimerase